MLKKQKKQQKFVEKELIAKAKALAGTTTNPAEFTVKVNYVHTNSTISITLPEHLGGLKTTAKITGKFSFLFKFGKDPEIATVSLLESEEKISSIPFAYNGDNVETGDIFHGLNDFDKKATHGIANFKTGEFKMTYVLSPQISFLSEHEIPLPGKKGQMLNEEIGKINPKTFDFRLEGKISIKTGPFAGTLAQCSEGGNGGAHEEHEPSCHVGSITLGRTKANCGEYAGEVRQSGPICGDGICNLSDDYTIVVVRGDKEITLGPKECSDALNGINVHGSWYIMIIAPGAICTQFPVSLGIRVFYVF